MTYILLSSAALDAASTRSFNEFKTEGELAQTLITYFEDYLLEKKSNNEPLEYDSDELFEFIESFFAELVCLAKQGDTELWIPFSVSWVKEVIYMYLRSNSDGGCEPDDILMAE